MIIARKSSAARLFIKLFNIQKFFRNFLLIINKIYDIIIRNIGISEESAMKRAVRIEYRALSMILILFMLFSAFPIRSNALNSGQCGPNLFWNYNNNILTVTGYGRMDDFVKKASSSRSLGSGRRYLVSRSVRPGLLCPIQRR